jgi:ribokinase
MMDLVVRLPRLPVAGESLFAHDFRTFVGGKGGNQALAAARLGAEAVMVGRVGADVFGEEIVRTLEGSGVDCSAVRRDTETSTGVAVPMVFDDGGNSILSAPQANLRLSPADVEAAGALIERADVLLVQFEVAAEATKRAVELAREASVPVMLSPAPFDAAQAELVALADYLLPNEVEARLLEPELAEPEAQAVELRKRGPSTVVVTRGEQGAVVASEAGVEAFAAYPVKAVDSVGAGDAFCGALAVALAEGAPFGEAVRFACAAGAICVTRPGAAASLPTREEVLALMSTAREGNLSG